MWAKNRRERPIVRCAAQGDVNPEAVIGISGLGGTRSAADRVRCQWDRVRGSDVDLLCDFDRVIDLDAKIPHRAFDLGVPEQ
jgi:hypothetical protein